MKNMEMNPPRKEPMALLAGVAILFVWSAISPRERLVWAMEVAPVVAGTIVLFLTRKRFPLTPLAYRLMAFFAVILLVGGKYTYAEVPVGFWIRDVLGLHRNPFDRLGHFLQGVVPAILAREVLIRCTPLRPGKALFWICCSIALGISASYELFEWWFAELAAPEQGLAFLGSQGDIWDAQWDMFMALCGSILAQLLFARAHDRQIAQVR